MTNIHTNIGKYIGPEGSYLSGGIFSLKDQYFLRSTDNWKVPLAVPTSGLQLYLDASVEESYSGTGNVWSDISGNDKHFTWTTTPSYNASGIKYFNTLNKTANGAASNSFGITNTTGYTFFYTIFQNSLATASAFRWTSSNAASSNGIFSHSTWSDGVIYFDQGGCCESSQRTQVALPSPTGTWHVIALRADRATTRRTIWRNNSILTTNTVSMADINLSSSLAVISPGTNWDARLGQFLVYNRPLSDSEMTTVYNDLRVKVGL
jgi:hypothetical protein